jgi:hypothetical protein
LHGRGARDDAQVLGLKAPKLRDHFFRQAGAKVLIERNGSGPEAKLVKPGLVLLRIATDKGTLVLEF